MKFHRYVFFDLRNSIPIRQEIKMYAFTGLEGKNSDYVIYSIIDNEWQGVVKDRLEGYLENARYDK